MPSDFRRRVPTMIALGWLGAFALASPAQSQSSQHPASSPVASATQAAMTRVISDLLSDASPHMRMGPTRTATAADSARAAAVVLATRAALGQYADVKVAERDGYYRNMPQVVDQPIYHYNSSQNFGAAMRGTFDLAKPVSLLYKKASGGELRLIGAMYGTGASAAPAELDKLLPISMAHWHEHVNLCYPGGGAGRFAQTDEGKAFLLRLFFSITSSRECEIAGGQFVPVEFGWMTHVYMFADSDDPQVIWGTDDAGNMDVHMGHPPTTPGTPRSLHIGQTR